MKGETTGLDSMKWSESESRSVLSDSLWPHGLNSPWNSPGQNTALGSLSLLHGIFPTQGLKPGLPHYRRILYQLSHKGSPRMLKWVAYPFSSRSSLPRNQTRVSCIAGGFFTNWAMKEAIQGDQKQTRVCERHGQVERGVGLMDSVYLSLRGLQEHLWPRLSKLGTKNEYNVYRPTEESKEQIFIVIPHVSRTELFLINFFSNTKQRHKMLLQMILPTM